VRFGGHQAAAGLEVELERLPELRRRFAEAIRTTAPSERNTGLDQNVLLLRRGDRPLDVLHDLDRLEPCGPDNPRPTFRVEGQVARAREVKGGHLKLDLDLGEAGALGGFFIAQGEQAERLRGRVTVTGDLRHTSFPGSGGVELFGDRIEVAADAPS
jgi:single-stranded-DNA-specific exonuclease